MLHRISYRTHEGELQGPPFFYKHFFFRGCLSHVASSARYIATIDSKAYLGYRHVVLHCASTSCEMAVVRFNARAYTSAQHVIGGAHGVDKGEVREAVI